MNIGMVGDKSLPIRNITSIQFRAPGRLTNGYVQFATASGEARGGLSQAAHDENSVFFSEEQEPSFKRLVELVQSRMGIVENSWKMRIYF